MTATYVVLTLDEYQELVNAASHAPARASGAGESLAAAIALVTARRAGLPATPATVTPDIDQDAIIRWLVNMTADLLDAATADHGHELLTALGLVAQQDHQEHP